MSNDRNFDDLAHRFSDNIYGSPKGQIRLAILKEDLDNFLSRFPEHTCLRVLDAGCGLGYMALYLAESGHEVVLCDHSAEMLQRAQQMFPDRTCLPHAVVMSPLSNPRCKHYNSVWKASSIWCCFMPCWNG